jgi:hypothetical protein
MILFDDFINESESEFDAKTFFARWFLSKKKLIPQSWFKYLEEKYPYSGRAFRLDDSPYDKPYASWCKSIEGIRKYNIHKMTHSPAGAFVYFNNYVGTIVKGVDLAAFVKDNNTFGESGQLIIDIEEVFPTVTVKNITQI